MKRISASLNIGSKEYLTAATKSDDPGLEE
jgi:hypothetical protein